MRCETTENYWLRLEAEARIIAWRNNCSAEWSKLADLYHENAIKAGRDKDQQKKGDE